MNDIERQIAELNTVARWAWKSAKRLEKLNRFLKETPMGQTADAINAEKAIAAGYKTQLDAANTTIATLQAEPKLDADDVAAIQSVLGVPNSANLVFANGVLTDTTTSKTVYTTTATTAPDATAWPPAGTYGNKPVYTFSGDTAAGQTNGNGQDGGVWSTIPDPSAVKAPAAPAAPAAS